MKIIAVHFDYGGIDKYEKLARVFEHSIRKNSPGVDYEIIKIEAPAVQSNNKSFESNTVKLDLWYEKLLETSNNVVFMDVDMMILKNILDAFDDPNFDIGITIRNGPHAKRLPMNGGVVFVRNNENGRAFIKLWAEANRFLYEDILKTNGTKHHKIWRQRYGGMNQAAYGYMINNLSFAAKIKEFPCSEWNACLEHWKNENLNWRIVHVKSRLRTAVLGSRPLSIIDVDIRKLVKQWRDLASEVGYDFTQIENMLVGLGRPRSKTPAKKISRYQRRYA